MPPPRQDKDVTRGYSFFKILRCLVTSIVGWDKRKHCHLMRLADKPSINTSPTGEGVSNNLNYKGQSGVPHEIDCHPELVSGSHRILKRRGQSSAYKMLKQVQHDPNTLKRTYSLINLFTYLPRKRCAFTLAEVLITLGIIGIVAAMTLPSLISNYKYIVLENQLKAAYSDLNQAAKLFQVHNGMSVSEYAATENALKEFSKEFNSVLKNSNNSWDSTDKDGNTIGASPGYKWSDIKGEKQYAPICDTSGYFWDTQGRVIGFDDSPYLGQNGPKVCIDINGQKAPNRYGVDYFVFMFTTDGYVIPYGQEHKDNPACTGFYTNCTMPKEDYCQYTTGTNYEQITCSNYAIANIHPKDSNKDYWHDFVRGR